MKNYVDNNKQSDTAFLHLQIVDSGHVVSQNRKSSTHPQPPYPPLPWQNALCHNREIYDGDVVFKVFKEWTIAGGLENITINKMGSNRGFVRVYPIVYTFLLRE